MLCKYDFHIHSCLSPCGENEMTPVNIAGMAMLAGYDIIALSDHNSCKNCRALIAAAENYGIAAIPAMELTTSEEAHILCILPTLEAAEDFGLYVRERLPDIKNEPEFFGNQYIMDEEENIVGEEDRLLVSATDIGVYDVARLVKSYGGVAIPAHIDRSSFSVISNLGFVDNMMGFDVMEITRNIDPKAFAEEHPELRGKPYIIDSDAHSLEAMPDACYLIDIEEKTAAAVIEAIRGGRFINQFPK